MKCTRHNSFEGEGKNAWLEFYDNPANNCFNLQEYPMEIPNVGKFFLYLFVPFYPIDIKKFAEFRAFVEEHSDTIFYFKSCAEEHHLADIMGDKKYRKSPVYMFYQNGEKVFEQIGGYLTEDQLNQILSGTNG